MRAFGGFLRWYVHQQNAVDAVSRGVLRESFEAVCEHRIVVREENDGKLGAGCSHLAGGTKHVAHRHVVLQRAVRRLLIRDTVRHRVAKRDAKLDDIHARVGEPHNKLLRSLQRRVAARDVCDERGATFRAGA